jgi:hypothetical protein
MLGGTQRPPCSWPPGADLAFMAGYLGMGADVLQSVHGRYHAMSRETGARLRPGMDEFDADGGDRGIAQIVDLSEVT